MVEGYLIGARKLFDKWDHDNNYQIFIPESEKLLGYFKNEKLEFSQNKFYEDISNSKKLKNLNSKVSKRKFVKKIELDEGILSSIESAKTDLEKAEKNVNHQYNRLSDFFDFIKFQK